jgi:NitT/TauT family transport system substrate-binding protein
VNKRICRAIPIFLISLLIFLAGVAAYAGSLPMIKVGHVGHDHQIALYVAAEAGKALEKEYGVYLKELKPQEAYDLYDRGRPVARVQMIRVGGGSKMPAALEQGHIEVGLGGLGPVAKFVDKGADLKVLAPLNNDGDALIMQKGFKAENWEEFVQAVKNSERPIKIGYKAPMAVAYMILARALKEEGLSFGPESAGPDGRPVQVVTVNLHGLGNALPSLESGIVDGMVVNEPMGSILVQKGVGKRVADLATLPPKGKWEGHPCCIVAASEDAIKKKRGIIISLLKIIAAGGDLMARDINKAFEAEARWTKTAPAVGRKSIPNVSYVIRPDVDWLEGVDTWTGLMTTSGHFKKRLKGKSTEEIRTVILDLSPMEEALSGLMLRSEAE